MSDATTGMPIQVSTDVSGPYIMLPAVQVDRVRKILEVHSVPHWVDHLSISVNGKPAVGWIYLGLRTDPGAVQAILDAAA